MAVDSYFKFVCSAAYILFLAFRTSYKVDNVGGVARK